MTQAHAAERICASLLLPDIKIATIKPSSPAPTFSKEKTYWLTIPYQPYQTRKFTIPIMSIPFTAPVATFLSRFRELGGPVEGRPQG
jgi:hypothetical protein